jgi:GNAT superfamily N-acetyltransferase
MTAQSYIHKLGNECLEAFRDADHDESIGKNYEILPDTPFTPFDKESAFDPTIEFGDDDFEAIFVGDGWQVGVHNDTGLVRAYNTVSEDEECIGEFNGPSLVVHPKHRGKGVGKHLAAAKLLYDGGENPQSQLDEIGYSKGGLRAMSAGLALAKDLVDRHFDPSFSGRSTMAVMQ